MNSIKNKEPNAIDELFQRKMGNYTVEPSAEIREKFLFQINQKKKARPIWYFSAAASVIFMCGLGWFLYAIPSENTLAPEVAIDTEVNTPVRGSNISTDSEDMSKEQSVSQLASNSVVTIESIKAPSVKEVVERPVAMEVLKIQIPERSITGVVEMDEPIQDILTLALQELEKRKNKAEKEDRAKTNSLFQKGAGETIIIVTSDIPDEGEEEIFIPGINSDSPITLAQATGLGEAMIEEDRSFIAKVFTELRHLKHGEKVKLNTLTPSSALVSNEDETFFSHETNQLRQRLRWFKGKVSREL